MHTYYRPAVSSLAWLRPFSALLLGPVALTCIRIHMHICIYACIRTTDLLFPHSRGYNPAVLCSVGPVALVCIRIHMHTCACIHTTDLLFPNWRGYNPALLCSVGPMALTCIRGYIWTECWKRHRYV